MSDQPYRIKFRRDLDVGIPAHYSGVCPDCGERWQPGDLIRSEQALPKEAS